MSEAACPQPAVDAAGSPSISAYLVSDHRRLDALAADAARLVREGALAAAAVPFAQFVGGLNRHIDIEEQVLFPAFERAAGASAACTIVMRAEHVEIRRCLDRVRGSLERGDADEFERAMHGLTQLVARHDMKEERVLYPMADRALRSESERLVARMAAL